MISMDLVSIQETIQDCSPTLYVSTDTWHVPELLLSLSGG